MNYNNPDPPKTVGVRAKAISSTAPTKREVERLKRLERLERKDLTLQCHHHLTVWL